MSECACHATMERETSDKNPGTADQSRWPWGKSRDGADKDGWDIREEGEMSRFMTCAKQTHTVFIIPSRQMWCDHIWKCAVASAHAMCVVQPEGTVRVQNQSGQPINIKTTWRCENITKNLCNSTTDNNQEPTTTPNELKQTTQTWTLETDIYNLEQPLNPKTVHKKVETTKKTIETMWNISNTFFKKAIYKTTNERYSGNRVSRSWPRKRGNTQPRTHWATDRSNWLSNLYIDDERSCFFGDIRRQRENLAIQTIQEPPIEEKIRTRKKANVDPKEPEERSLVKSKHRTRNGGQKKIVLDTPKEIEARMAFRKVMEAFRKVGFRT